MTTIHLDQSSATPGARRFGPKKPRRSDPYLARLLADRDRLARLSTAQASHAIPHAADTFTLMVQVEEEIAARYPRTHGRLFATWVSQITRMAHEPGERNSSCPLCPTARPDTAPMPNAA